MAGQSLSTLLLWTLVLGTFTASIAAAGGPAPVGSRHSYRSGGSHHGSSGYRSHGSYRGHGNYRGSHSRPDNYQQQYQQQLDALHVSGGSRLPSSLFHPGGGGDYYGAPYYVDPSYVVHVPIDPGYQPPAPEPLIDVPPAPAAQPIYIIVQTPAAAPAAVAPSPAPVVETAPAAPPRPRATAPGEVRIEVNPPEASVYLDDRLLGTGEEVALGEAMRLRPGVHLLEVTHPDHPSQRLVFGVSSGAPMEVGIDLEATRADRRTRLATADDLVGGR